MIDLSGKVALISGAASGIGAATARCIVSAGGKVAIADRDVDHGRTLAGELDASAMFVELDVIEPAQWANAVAATVDRFGILNVLVSNAGIFDYGELGTFSPDQWDRVLNVNLKGSFLGLSAAAPALKAAGSGSAILVSSVAGLQGTAGVTAYAASKFGLRGLMKAAAMELAPHGIRVNTVHPGTIRTPMSAGAPEAMAQTVALQRFGEPDEIAGLIAYLASDLSSFSTGAEFVADGGESAGVVRNLANEV